MMQVERLAELRLKWQTRPEETPAGKFGRYLGRGDGRFLSDGLGGDVTWDLFETQGDGICAANFDGRIVIDHGGEIGFEMLGFFRREPGSKIWNLAAAIRFKSADPRYDNFCDRPGFATGEFDMASYQHRYSIFMPAAAPVHNVADNAAPTRAVGTW